MLTTGLSSKASSKKIQYYLGIYVGFFTVMSLLLYLIHRPNKLNRVTDAMHLSAYRGCAYTPSDSADSDSIVHCKLKYIDTLLHHDRHLLRIMLEDSKSNDDSSDNDNDDIDFESEVSVRTTKDIKQHSSNLLSRIASRMKKRKYSDVFHAYLVQHRCIIGCEPLLFPEGVSISLWGRRLLVLPAGRAEDFILYLSNNEAFFGCIFSAKGSKMRRNGRIVVYMMNNATVFFLYSISKAVLNYLNATADYSVMFSFFVIAPASLTITWVFTSLYTCSLIDKKAFKNSTLKAYEDELRVVGRLILIPLSFLCFGLLVLSAIFSRGYNQYLILGTYISIHNIDGIHPYTYS